MKENDSGKENNYTLICVWQLCFIPLAHKAKIKGDIVESVLSAFNGVGMGCVWRQASLVGHSPAMVRLPLVLQGRGRPGGALEGYVLHCRLPSFMSVGFPWVWPSGKEKSPSPGRKVQSPSWGALIPSPGIVFCHRIKRHSSKDFKPAISGDGRGGCPSAKPHTHTGSCVRKKCKSLMAKSSSP